MSEWKYQHKYLHNFCTSDSKILNHIDDIYAALHINTQSPEQQVYNKNLRLLIVAEKMWTENYK